MVCVHVMQIGRILSVGTICLYLCLQKDGIGSEIGGWVGIVMAAILAGYRKALVGTG